MRSPRRPRCRRSGSTAIDLCVITFHFKKQPIAAYCANRFFGKICCDWLVCVTTFPSRSSILPTGCWSKLAAVDLFVVWFNLSHQTAHSSKLCQPFCWSTFAAISLFGIRIKPPSGQQQQVCQTVLRQKLAAINLCVTTFQSRILATRVFVKICCD